jgi:hypothetical protein
MIKTVRRCVLGIGKILSVKIYGKQLQHCYRLYRLAYVDVHPFARGGNPISMRKLQGFSHGCRKNMIFKKKST